MTVPRPTSKPSAVSTQLWPEQPAVHDRVRYDVVVMQEDMPELSPQRAPAEFEPFYEWGAPRRAAPSWKCSSTFYTDTNRQTFN